MYILAHMFSHVSSFPVDFFSELSANIFVSSSYDAPCARRHEKYSRRRSVTVYRLMDMSHQ